MSRREFAKLAAGFSALWLALSGGSILAGTWLGWVTYYNRPEWVAEASARLFVLGVALGFPLAWPLFSAPLHDRSISWTLLTGVYAANSILWGVALASVIMLLRRRRRLKV